RNESRCCSTQIDALDASGNLGFGGFAEFQLVEDVTGDPVVIVGVPQSVERAARIVRARRRQFLMPGLQTERRRDSGKARVERHQLHFEAAFLLLVGKDLADADRRWIEGIGKPDLVVVIVGGTGPEPDGVDDGLMWMIFTLGAEFGLVAVDSGLV